MYFEDRSMIEAASWRLASELIRRHPEGVRLFHSCPCTGQYDVIWVTGIQTPGVDVRFNRNGTIQIHGRADGAREISWEPTPWEVYLAADPKGFIEELEAAAGWTAPDKVPPSTAETLSYRVLAALAAIGAKTVHPISIEPGEVDSDWGSGPNEALQRFTIPEHLTAVRDDDFHNTPGFRFWIPVRDGEPLMAIEQTSATAWFIGSAEPLELAEMYRRSHKEPALVAADLLRRALSADSSA